MQKSTRYALFSILLLAAYLVSACAGNTTSIAPERSVGPKVLAAQVAFTGAVESISGNTWVIDGKTVIVDPQNVDPNIQVGDFVKVEGVVSADGQVTATSVETSAPDDVAGASEPAEAVSTPGAGTPEDSSQAEAGNEVFGLVEVVSDTSITIDGVVYQIADFSEIKDAVAVGDQVKVHFILNPDGSLTIREIEKSVGVDDDGNGINQSGNDDGPDHDANDDHGNDGGNHDDDGGSSGKDNSGDD